MAKNQTRAEKVRTLEKRIENLGHKMNIEKYLLTQKEDELAIIFQETRICLLKAEIVSTRLYLEQLNELEGLLNL